MLAPIQQEPWMRHKLTETQKHLRGEEFNVWRNRIATDETIAVRVKLYSLEQKQDNSQTHIMAGLLLQEDVIGLAIKFGRRAF